jgi:hypothetical protein
LAAQRSSVFLEHVKFFQPCIEVDHHQEQNEDPGKYGHTAGINRPTVHVDILLLPIVIDKRHPSTPLVNNENGLNAGTTPRWQLRHPRNLLRDAGVSKRMG